MTKKIVFGVAAVAIAVVVMAPSASASCLGIRNATTFGSATSYWVVGSANEGSLTGMTWQLGSPGSWSTGNCNTNSLGPGGSMVYFSGPGANLNLDMGACGNGCPASGSTLVVVALNKRPPAAGGGVDFIVDNITETPANPSANFDYGSQGNHNFAALPRPHVTASGRAPGVVNMQITIDPLTAGLYGPSAANGVLGFKILSKASATDPGRDASAYDVAPAALLANPGGTGTSGPVALACPDLQDRWIATQIQFEGGDAPVVSPAVQVRCDPALANPKFKNLAPKKIGAPRTVPN